MCPARSEKWIHNQKQLCPVIKKKHTSAYIISIINFIIIIKYEVSALLEPNQGWINLLFNYQMIHITFMHK